MPQANEQRDGIATVRWLREQPWCDGTIATAGMSYLGYTQYATATAPGTDIAAMALSVTMADLGEPTFATGSITLSGSLGWAQMMSFGTDSARGGGRLRSLAGPPRRWSAGSTRCRSRREITSRAAGPSAGIRTGSRTPRPTPTTGAAMSHRDALADADRSRVDAHRLGRPVPAVDAA